MDINYNLLPSQKRRKQGLKITVDLFSLAEELYEELNKIGVIDRLKNVNQLGMINVPRELKKSRYDYVVLQLYLHQIIRENIQDCLEFRYSNRLRISDLLEDHEMREDDFSNKNEVTLADAMQILSIVYSIGHFYNTFVSSQAVVMLAEKDLSFYHCIVNSSNDRRIQNAASFVLKSHNYQRGHLINTLFVLEKCDCSKKSIKLAKELVMSYLLEYRLPNNSKLHYYFKLFRKVRTISFVAYDLQIARMPFTLEIWNRKGMLYFLREFLAKYNNNESAESLVLEMANMLDSSVYNNMERVICYTQISKRMVAKLSETEGYSDYYKEYWQNPDSIFNMHYQQKRDYEAPYLKLTFRSENRELAEELYKDLDQQSNTRVGYYLRHNGDFTIVLSIKKKCDDKTETAFKVLRRIIRHARIMHLLPDDECFILSSKFFLYYLFNNRQLAINPILHKTKCVICTKGKKSRIQELQQLLADSRAADADKKHEVCALIDYLQNDSINDVTITVPGSTVVYKETGEGLAEFDGIIIYPNRTLNQVVLIEAKNTDYRPSYGKSCLKGKLKNIGIPFDPKRIIVFNHDAYYRISL